MAKIGKFKYSLLPHRRLASLRLLCTCFIFFVRYPIINPKFSASYKCKAAGAGLSGNLHHKKSPALYKAYMKKLKQLKFTFY